MKIKTQHRCTSCDATTPRWSGRCVNCGEWNSLVEEQHTTPTSSFGTPGTMRTTGTTPITLSSVSTESAAPAPTGIAEFDRILGGGLVPGSVTLISGEPGIGKSTLVLQLAASVVARGGRTLVISGEESAEQLQRRGLRLAEDASEVAVLSTTSLEAVIVAIRNYEPTHVVIDSIQTIVDENISGSAGSVTQVRECANALISCAKSSRIAMVLIGHVNKEGTLAGPRTLEHLVDTVCSFEGDRHHSVRILSIAKHRFGPTGELGIFEMTGEGLVGVDDPSSFLLADRHEGIIGSVVTPVLEGVRPLLVEIQALVVPSTLASPRRVVQGVVPGRLALVAAVLERRAGMRLNTADIFASIVGGVRVTEPATDLALALCLASAISGIALGDDLVVMGEIGLGGELRQVVHCERRLAEAQRHGFRRAIVPRSAPSGPDGMQVIPVATVVDAIAALDLTRALVSARV